VARNGSRVTILDVAALAGVHAATVSRALNRPEKVATETRIRVESAVQELGFVPNRAARGLITGQTGNIAVIVPDITNPFFALLVRSVERAAREQDLQVLLVDTGERSDEEERAARTLSPEVDGLIVVSPRKLHRSLDDQAGTRIVFVNRPAKGRTSVVMRSASAAADALHHLADLGHSRLVYVGGPPGSWAAKERQDVVVRTGRISGIEVEAVQADAPTVEGAARAVDVILERGATAVMAFNDQLALGVIAGLTRRGVRVPDDVSVVGCDDVPMAELVAPPLTTITMPTDRAGIEAVGLLSGEPRTVELSGTLVIRGSTGPAPAGPQGR
jgi:DNA-binding LacI/PurR family transcriptional regulator